MTLYPDDDVKKVTNIEENHVDFTREFANTVIKHIGRLTARLAQAGDEAKTDNQLIRNLREAVAKADAQHVEDKKVIADLGTSVSHYKNVIRTSQDQIENYRETVETVRRQLEASIEKQKDYNDRITQLEDEVCESCGSSFRRPRTPQERSGVGEVSAKPEEKRDAAHLFSHLKGGMPTGHNESKHVIGWGMDVGGHPKPVLGDAASARVACRWIAEKDCLYCNGTGLTRSSNVCRCVRPAGGWK